MAAEPLTAACKLAFAVARHGREVVPSINAPAPMRSFLWVAQLPPRAITVAQRVINTDEEFRSRVAEAATEAEVGRAGYIWLTRPPGWESEFAALTGEVITSSRPPVRTQPDTTPSAPGPSTPTASAQAIVSEVPPIPTPPASKLGATKEVSGSDLDSELASLRQLVDRLADEREIVSKSASTMESEVVQSKAESTALISQLDTLKADLASARRERDSAFAQCEAIRSKSVKLQTEKESLAAAVEELASVRNERDALADRLSVSDQARSDLENQLAQLTEQWEAANAEMADISEQRLAMEAELDRLSAARVVSVQDNAILFQRIGDQLARLEAERNLLSSQLGKARAGLEGTRSAFAAATRSVDSELGATEASMRALAGSQSLGKAVDDLSESGKDLKALVEDAAAQAETDAAAAERSSAATSEPEYEELVPLVDPGQIQSKLPEISESVAPEDSEKWAPREDEGDPFLADAAAVAFSEHEAASEDTVATGAEVSALEAEVFVSEVEASGPDAEVSALDAEVSVPDNEAISYEALTPDKAAVLEEVADPDEAVGSHGDSVFADEGEPSSEGQGLHPEDSLATAEASVVSELPPIPRPPTEAPEPAVAIPPMPAPPADWNDSSAESAVAVPESPVHSHVSPDPVAAIPPIPEPPRSPAGVPSVGRVQVVLSPEAAADPAKVASEVAQTLDIVMLVDADAVASLGWPTLGLRDRRAAVLGYLRPLAMESGAAIDAVFDGNLGEDTTLPPCEDPKDPIRPRLTHKGVSATDAIALLVNEYPAEWPLAVVTDHGGLVESATGDGAFHLSNAQLLDLFLTSL